MFIELKKVLSTFIIWALLIAVPSINVYAQSNVTTNLEKDTIQITESTIETTTDITTETNNTTSALNFTIGLSCNLGLNEKYQLYVKDQNGKIITSGLVYSSSNENVVSIDSNGKITGKKIGSATIYTNSENGTQASCNITVKNAPSSIKLNITSAKIGVGEKSVDLDSSVFGGYSKSRKYTSSNTKVACVDSSGIVTGIKEGSATITCTTFNNKKATCKITVGKKPTSIKITNSNKIIQKNSNNHQIKYALSSGAYSYKITYSIKDESIATINSKGIVTGKKCGKTTVTVKTYNGLTASQEITVNDNSLSLNVNSTQLALDNDNVIKVKYGTSVQKRNLEGFIITNENNTISENCKIIANGSVNVRSGAGTSYKIVASLKSGTAVTRIEKSVKKANGYTWDKIKFGNNQTGYVATNYVKLVKNNIKTIFIDFAVHGFEDEYYRDGQVLVNEANALIDYFAKHSTELKGYRLIIVPCANPDGTIAGTNNQRACSTAFGRCTANHIDINRDFGNFKAVETRALRDFIKQCNPTFYLNMHGWLDETIGDKNLNNIITKKLGLSKKINNYPTQDGYAIDWVHNNLKIPATLVEYKSSNMISTNKDINMIKAIIDSNGISTTISSSTGFPKAEDWKNGTTSETVYKVSNLTEKIDTIKAKGIAKCYGKASNSYIVVYSISNNKHKAGFVKYKGGVKNVPTENKSYKNGSTTEKVYADTSKKTVIGSLNPKERCKCLAKIDGMYLVVYNVSGTSKQKCGFVTYNGIS